MIPLNGSSDEGWGNEATAGNTIYHESSNYTLTISEKAPTQRGDASPLAIGDLWWSPHTGGLYIWHSDQITYYTEQFALTGKIPEGAPPSTYSTTREWVCTDPLAMVPQGDSASDDFFPYPDNLRNVFNLEEGVFVEEINVIISERAPLLNPDGSSIEVGTLWWSNANGKMYIFFNSTSGNVWVVTNPSSSHGDGRYTISELPWDGGNMLVPPGGDLPTKPGGLNVLSETEDQEHLWVLDYDQFISGDLYEIVLSADSNDNEVISLQSKGIYDPTNSQLKILRGVDQSATRGTIKTQEIPDLTVIRNLSHSIYEVYTDKSHGMLVGDKVTIYGSSIPQINTEHTVTKVGTIRKAIMRSRVNASTEVSDVFIDDPGFGYESDFYVEVSGDGIGAQIIAHVQTFEEGGTGQVNGFTIVAGGIGYTSAPLLFATPAEGQYARDYFAFIVEGQREIEQNKITYSCKSDTVVSDIHKVSVKDHGSGYLELPQVDGIIKKISDRAKGIPYLNGTSIAGVDMLLSGSRYSNPVPIFSDLFGTGTGAVGTCITDNDLIIGVNLIIGGEDYVEPVVEFVEMEDIVYADSEDIGAIKSVNVISPGRNIPSDLSIRPEIEIETRLLIEQDERFGFFDPGDKLFQGVGSLKQAEATVVRYDPLNHTLLVDDIRGKIVKDEIIRTVSGKNAMVMNVKHAKTNINISGSALQSGRFIDEKSFVSSLYSVVQDSNYYQYFSYVISSQIQASRYNNFVKSMTHPAGFALFTEIEINESIQTITTVQTMDIDGDVFIVDIAGIEGDASQVLATDNLTSSKQVIGLDDK